MTELSKIAISIILFFSAMVFYGQGKPDHDKIKSLKIAFITEQLALTSKEAEAFWPVYNTYQADRDTLRKKEHEEIRQKLKEIESVSQKEANDLLNRYLALEEEEEELDKTFLKRLSKIISARKTLLLLKTEDDFKRKLIREYRHKRGGRLP